MEPGASLGPYRIDRELGAGGMGKVYAATGPDGVVALKVVHPQLLATEGFFKRFLREAQIGQSVLHDNAVRTLDCDATDKRLLDEALANVPEEYHESMCTNLRVNREILAAWREEFGDECDALGGTSPGESPTRAGDPLT